VKVNRREKHLKMNLDFGTNLAAMVAVAVSMVTPAITSYKALIR
jgi:hypothetical protein